MVLRPPKLDQAPEHQLVDALDDLHRVRRPEDAREHLGVSEDRVELSGVRPKDHCFHRLTRDQQLLYERELVLHHGNLVGGARCAVRSSREASTVAEVAFEASGSTESDFSNSPFTAHHAVVAAARVG